MCIRDRYEKGKVKQRRMHLTNVTLNKGHVRDGSQELFDDGKWSLAQLWSYIRRERLGDPDKMWRQVRSLAALALLAAEPKMSSQVDTSLTQQIEISTSNCFCEHKALSAQPCQPG